MSLLWLAMRTHLLRSASLIALFLAASPALAQQRPSPQEAEAMLRANPDLAAQVRARLQNSGLTPDQVRARLRDEGYPENLLDAYLTPGATSDTSSMPPATLAS